MLEFPKIVFLFSASACNKNREFFRTVIISFKVAIKSKK